MAPSGGLHRGNYRTVRGLRNSDLEDRMKVGLPFLTLWLEIADWMGFYYMLAAKLLFLMALLFMVGGVFTCSWLTAGVGAAILVFMLLVLRVGG